MQSMTITPKFIIFTDLDGTLLDRDTYSFEDAEPALRMIRRKRIPLVLSSRKTQAEIEWYRRQLGNDDPFISENGGAIFFPKIYFPFPVPYDRESEEYFVVELGTDHSRIVEALDSIKKETGIPIKGFSDLTKEELSSICGQRLEEADFAKQREYDEPFFVEAGEAEIRLVERKIAEMGMNCVQGGRFLHILGQNDKGKAVRILKMFYGLRFHSILTAGIGDSLDDVPMLLAVDYPIFLSGTIDSVPSLQDLTTIGGTGPRAWNEAILQLIDRLDYEGIQPQ